MSIKSKILALVLALITIFTVLVACDNGNTSSEKETVKEIWGDDTSIESALGSDAIIETVFETETETKEINPSDIDKKDYGTEFYLSILDDVNPPDYYWVEESDNDAMSEAVFARQQKVYDWLGVEIIGVGIGLSYKNYIEPFKTAVKNKDGSVDTLLSHVSTGVAGLVSEAYLRNIENVPGIDLTQDYWNIDFMDDLSVAGNYYLGFSNFNILSTHVIAFNKGMMDQYSGSIEKSPYDMVRDYTWTLDNMIEIVNLVYIDATSDGKTYDDTFGLAGRQWVPWVGFMQAANINLVDLDDSGKYSISVLNETNKERSAALVDRLTALSKSNSAYLDYYTSPEISVPFTSGRALLFLESTYNIVDFLNYDIAFGILPYPMWDEAQKDVGYRHLQWGGYICVPSYLDNEVMVGETLEVLSFFSDDVMITFYEKMLGKQVADVPDDRQMLDIIWQGVCTDFGQTFSDQAGGILYVLPQVTWPDSGLHLTSFIESLERSSNASLSAFVKKIEKNNKNRN
jgi:hypothetical protein